MADFDFDVLVIGSGPGGYVAAIRADALLRTNRTTRPQNWSLIRTAALEPRFRAALVERMLLDPDWREKLRAA